MARARSPNIGRLLIRVGLALFAASSAACRSDPALGLLPGDAGARDGTLGTSDDRGSSPADALSEDGPGDGGARADAAPGPDRSEACNVPVPSEPFAVATHRGAIRGAASGRTIAFRGIPFAEPPVGDLRFKPPVEHRCWNGVKNATHYGQMCPQYGLAGVFSGDEDCLTLNVWTPALGPRPDRLPVLFFIHGGANLIGASNEELGPGLNLYDGRSLTENEQVVVVTANYRLGALGFLAHPALSHEDARGVSGNYALLDQIHALRWVRENIAEFGGDPDQVMIFGESAGGLNVCMLLASPLAQGLFASAIIESGSCEAPPLARRESEGGALAGAIGCGLASNAAECLRSRPASAFVLATPVTASALSNGWSALPYGPNVDRYVLPEDPAHGLERSRDVPVILGTNAHETELFTPATVNTCFDYAATLRLTFPSLADRILAEYPCGSYRFARWAFVDVTTDYTFACPARRILRALKYVPQRRVYQYSYRYTRGDPLVRALRAFHASELALVFGTQDRLGYTASPSEVALSRQIQGYWARFARTHDPNGAGAPPWPEYDPVDDNAIVLDQGLSQSRATSGDHCDFWDHVGP